MTAPLPITARELMALRFTDPKWAVPGIPSRDLEQSFGRPKMGKSWLMLNLAVAIASGGRALGAVKVAHGCSPSSTRSISATTDRRAPRRASRHHRCR